MLKEYCKRITLLITGLIVSAVGIVLMLQANIGLEPWSVLQNGMSVFFGMTFGTASAIVGAGIIVIAVLFGESFGLGTLANIFVCPVFIDIILAWDLIPLMDSLFGSILMLVIGMELLAIGTWMNLKSALGAGPRDALMVALARKSRFSVGLCRAFLELIVIFLGWKLGGQVGIGTIITGFGVGTLINLNFSLFHFQATDVHQENLPETLRRITKQNP